MAREPRQDWLSSRLPMCRDIVTKHKAIPLHQGTDARSGAGTVAWRMVFKAC